MSKKYIYISKLTVFMLLITQKKIKHNLIILYPYGHFIISCVLKHHLHKSPKLLK